MNDVQTGVVNRVASAVALIAGLSASLAEAQGQSRVKVTITCDENVAVASTRCDLLNSLATAGAPSPVTTVGERWQVISSWRSGRATDDVRSRALEKAAGGQRWQTESKTSYTSASGFRYDAGVIVRHGYGAPLFMTRPFADDTVLPELFPAPDPGGVNWNAVFTVTTPDKQIHGIDLSGSFQAYMRLGPPPEGAPARDRGVRAGLHFKFK